jgi:hypothetical protein
LTPLGRGGSPIPPSTWRRPEPPRRAGRQRCAPGAGGRARPAARGRPSGATRPAPALTLCHPGAAAASGCAIAAAARENGACPGPPALPLPRCALPAAAAPRQLEALRPAASAACCAGPRPLRGGGGGGRKTDAGVTWGRSKGVWGRGRGGGGGEGGSGRVARAAPPRPRLPPPQVGSGGATARGVVGARARAHTLFAGLGEQSRPGAAAAAAAAAPARRNQAQGVNPRGRRRGGRAPDQVGPQRRSAAPLGGVQNSGRREAVPRAPARGAPRRTAAAARRRGAGGARNRTATGAPRAMLQPVLALTAGQKARRRGGRQWDEGRGRTPAAAWAEATSRQHATVLACTRTPGPQRALALQSLGPTFFSSTWRSFTPSVTSCSSLVAGRPGERGWRSGWVRSWLGPRGAAGGRPAPQVAPRRGSPPALHAAPASVAGQRAARGPAPHRSPPPPRPARAAGGPAHSLWLLVVMWVPAAGRAGDSGQGGRR